ncbi:hypothetical protein LJ756_08400 [Arthrobacter sp. zg-Y411]|uniref:hypothetical protein n=1 Tax=Arthrobacter zhangbolii TaxID=2886936 RepID=UPI001D1372B3|nr:hypothetical protein [Arthrobacter zhangbolii]MCC3294644.1 hypothetical protein [Arthrobacter zhangbolii]
MQIDEMHQGGTNVPVTRFSDVQLFRPSTEDGVIRYAAPLGRGIDLEAIQVNRRSDVLVVGFHGALTRETTELPRFERMATLLGSGHSLLFFSDPTLRLADNLQLAWYTGWSELDIRFILADWAVKAAEAVGAEHIIFTGGSGGGFAALQVSAFVPDSLALAFNPQTIISKYLVEGKYMGPQQRYVKVVMPEFSPVPPEKLTPAHDWASPLGERVAVPLTYTRPLENRVLYIQNSNDSSHMTDHYKPFRQVAESGPNASRIRFDLYEGPHAHVAQNQQVMDRGLAAAIDWLRP